MASCVKLTLPTIDVSQDTVGVPVQLYSGTGDTFDLASLWTIDANLNVTGSTNGQLFVYLQNDNPVTSTYFVDASLTFAISGGTFVNNSTKQTVTNNSLQNTRWAYFFWKKGDTSTGTGTISFDGFKSVM